MQRSTMRSSTGSGRTLRTARWVSMHRVERRAEAGEHLVDGVVGVAAVDEPTSCVEAAHRDRFDVDPSVTAQPPGKRGQGGEQESSTGGGRTLRPCPASRCRPIATRSSTSGASGRTALTGPAAAFSGAVYSRVDAAAARVRGRPGDDRRHQRLRALPRVAHGPRRARAGRRRRGGARGAVRPRHRRRPPVGRASASASGSPASSPGCSPRITSPSTTPCGQRLHAAFTDDELVELALCVGSWVAFGRLNRVFDVDGGCRVP